MKKWFFLGFSLGCILLLYFIFIKGIASSDPIAHQKEKKSYFSVVPVSFIKTNEPCVTVTIDGKTFTVLLDLGCRGHLSLLARHINTIPSRKLVGNTKLKYNFRGVPHSAPYYTISRVALDSVSWPNPYLEQLDEEFFEQTRLDLNTPTTDNPHDGLLGWQLFQSMNLLLDMANWEIAVCDGLDTLRKNGYAVDSWVKTPLLLDRGLVEFEAMTPEGLARCFLDTGATVCILSKGGPSEKISQISYSKEDPLIEYSTFLVNGTDIGPVVFRLIPNNFPIPISLTLGMTFLLRHQVFIDFKEKQIYFGTSQTPP